MCLMMARPGQTCRQRRSSGGVGVARAEPVFEEPPVDGGGELRERMVQVDDLIEPSRRSVGRIGVAPCRIGQSKSHLIASDQFASNRGAEQRLLANAVIYAGRKDLAAQGVPDSSRRTNWLIGAFLWCEVRECVCDRIPQVFDGSRSDLAQVRLEFGECVLDRIEVGRIGREESPAGRLLPRLPRERRRVDAPADCPSRRSRPARGSAPALVRHRPGRHRRSSGHRGSWARSGRSGAALR